MSTATSPDLSTTLPRGGASTGRLIGLDLARGIAVIGMFTVHAPPAAGLLEVFHGRAAVLFAVLAGVSLSLIDDPQRPSARTPARARIAIRAVVLFVLGLALTSIHAPFMVILQSYGVLFLLSLPVLRLRATALAALAAAWAVAGPLMSFAIRSHMPTPRVLGYVPGFGDVTSWHGIGFALQSVLLTGAYPVLTWVPFVLTGMALGKLDLRAVRGHLVGFGAVLALAGYGISWMAMHIFGGFDRVLALLPGIPPSLVPLVLGSDLGTVPTTDPVYLLTSTPHSGTTFEIVGSTGVAVAVLGACLFAERFRRALAPLAAVGALPLTSYVGQCFLLQAFASPALKTTVAGQPVVRWLLLVTAAVVFTAVWRRFLGRGPLERGLHRLSCVPTRPRPSGTGRRRGPDSLLDRTESR